MAVEVLFLDAASITGYAAGSLGRVEAWGKFELPRTYENVGKYLNIAQRKITALVERFNPALLAYESPWINPRRDTMLAVRKLSGIPNVIEQIADGYEIECLEADSKDIATHFLGRDRKIGRENKKIATKVKCRDLGWNVSDDNEADALAGLSYILACKHPLSALATTPLSAFLLPVQ